MEIDGPPPFRTGHAGSLTASPPASRPRPAGARTARVAVVIRTKDRAVLLERALRSVISQTLEDWEAVIVNDGGDPFSVGEALAALPSGYRNRFRTVHADVSRGRWASANAGVLATTAPLVVLHDDDDTWHPEFLAQAAGYLAAHPERDGVVSRIEIVWEERRGERFVPLRREPFQQDLRAPTLGDALLFNRFVPIGFVYRRSLHAQLGLYDETLPVVGDWDFNLRVLARGALDYLGDVPYAYWHQRKGQDGAAGNSVIGCRDDHEKHDALIRDQALREYVDEHGAGLVLYLTKFIDRRLVDVENGIRDEMRRARRRGILSRVAGRLARLRR